MTKYIIYNTHQTLRRIKRDEGVRSNVSITQIHKNFIEIKEMPEKQKFSITLSPLNIIYANKH